MKRRNRRRVRLPAASSEETRLPPPGSVLRALTAGAMALPGVVGLAGRAHADSPVEKTTVDGQFSYYREDNLRPKKTDFGSERDRMEIYSYNVRLTTPLTDRSDLEANAGFETMSGASPWFVLPDLANIRNGRPVQVMSQATIDDQRGDLLLKGNYYFDAGKISASTGFSIENDYTSVSFGTGAEHSFNDKNTTLAIGAGASLDWINPTDAKLFDRVRSENKQAYSVFGTFSQIVTRHSAIQSTFSFDYSDGYLADPYKRAYIESLGSTRRDTRPDSRKQFTWLTRYRHNISGLHGTLHLDYKFYADDWSIDSHTFDLAWYQSLPFGFQLVPSFRYYSQSQADFYEVFYPDVRSNGLYSSDYRLSPFGAIGYGLKATWTLEDHPAHVDWLAVLSYERYQQSAGLALQHVSVENPGLVASNLFTIQLTVKF